MKALVLILAVARAVLEFEVHFDPTASGGTNNVGSCYNTQYYYYTSFACNTVTENCVKEVSYCSTVKDVHEENAAEALRERNRLIAIIVPSGVVGCCILTCIFGLIAGKFGYKYGKKAYDRKQA